MILRSVAARARRWTVRVRDQGLVVIRSRIPGRQVHGSDSLFVRIRSQTMDPTVRRLSTLTGRLSTSAIRQNVPGWFAPGEAFRGPACATMHLGSSR